MLLSFSLKKKVTKEKVAAGFCCYESAVIGQGQWLPQHYQCCPEKRLFEASGGFGQKGNIRYASGGLSEKRAMRRPCGRKLFSDLTFGYFVSKTK